MATSENQEQGPANTMTKSALRGNNSDVISLTKSRAQVEPSAYSKPPLATRFALPGVVAAVFLSGCGDVPMADSEVATTTQSVTIVDKVSSLIPPGTKEVAEKVSKVFGAFSNVKSYVNMATTAATLLTNLKGPEGPAKLSEIRAELYKLARAQDWKVNSSWSAEIWGKLQAGMDAALRCQAQQNCATNDAAWAASDEAGAALYALAYEEMPYFLRLYDENVTAGAWRTATLHFIPIPSPSHPNGWVFDWRDAIPHYLSFLQARIVSMAVMYPGFSVIASPYDGELATHRDALQRYYSLMRDGVKCGISSRMTSSGPVVPSWYEYTMYCADIYTGTYASANLGIDTVLPNAATTDPIKRGLMNQVYELMPLAEMKHVISILDFYLDPHAHGFMAESDRSDGGEPVYLNAWGGAAEGTVLRLHRDCKTSNRDCTWQYRDGMLLSDADPSLAIMNGWNAQLTRSCTASNPSCVWHLQHGMWLDGNGKSLATTITKHEAYLGDGGDCTAATPGCTWTMRNVMFSANLSDPESMAMRAWGQDSSSPPYGSGSAADFGRVSQYNCSLEDPSCTWTLTRGMILSDANPAWGLNAWGGALNPDIDLRITSWCELKNTDCTWNVSRDGIIVDNGGKMIRSWAFDPTRLYLSYSAGDFVSSTFHAIRARD